MLKCHLRSWNIILICYSLQTGSPYGLFRDLLSNSHRGELQWSSYSLSSACFYAWLIFHLASLLDSTKIATVAHSNQKTRTTQADISVKKSENYCLKAKPWMGTPFLYVPYVIYMKKWPWRARNENERKNRADCIISSSSLLFLVSCSARKLK